MVFPVREAVCCPAASSALCTTGPGAVFAAPGMFANLAQVACWQLHVQPSQRGPALLAQLVARGSDKAKVIGSSPVESNHLPFVFHGLRSCIFFYFVGFCLLLSFCCDGLPRRLLLPVAPNLG